MALFFLYSAVDSKKVEESPQTGALSGLIVFFSFVQHKLLHPDEYSSFSYTGPDRVLQTLLGLDFECQCCFPADVSVHDPN